MVPVPAAPVVAAPVPVLVAVPVVEVVPVVPEAEPIFPLALEEPGAATEPADCAYEVAEKKEIAMSAVKIDFMNSS